MKPRITLVACAALLLSFLTVPPVDASGSGWLTDWKRATETAKEEERPLLVEFTNGGDSEACKKLNREVFYKYAFKKWAKKNVVLVSVDLEERKGRSEEEKERSADLVRKFEVKSYPTVLLLSKEGEELGRYGYVKGGVDEWLEEVRPVVESVTTGAGKWLENFEEAKKLSRATGRPIMADFTGSDWCGWCKKLKSEVFDTPEFKQWAARNVILLELDYPRNTPQSDELKEQNRKLQQHYRIKGYPTVLFLDAKEKVLARTGYVRGGAEAWIGDAESKLGKR